MTTPTLLVAGTASHVGKSTVAAGLCRLFSNRGLVVAPFKAQNMSNNARAVAISDGDGFGEIGVSQYVQARAARVTPVTDHNPVLLKPHGDGASQLVVHGRAIGKNTAGDYYADDWHRARDAARASFDRLAADADVVVAEGAGSIAEINLHDRDLANVETARFTDADILLVADIERGGVFASLVGTLELLPSDLREQVVGAVITKFRGDPSLLESGLDAFEDRTGVPVLGVVPYDDPGLPEEDSLSLPPEGEWLTIGDDDGVPDSQSITIGVPRLPRISNATDFEPLADVPGVRVSYLPLGASLATIDGVVLPGSKNTVDDLLALREAGFDDELDEFDGPIVGICGGYQLLGQRIDDADIEGTGDSKTVDGLGYLPTVTTFSPEKRVEAVSVEFEGAGPLAGASGVVEGYEIHQGTTRVVGEAERLAGDGSAVRQVAGTYIHDLFANEAPQEAFVDAVYEHTGRKRPDEEAGAETADPYERAAALIETHVDVEQILEIGGV
ncbi:MULTISPECIES: cobyric acid synthase [Haloferax]|uniref:Probable cobyric acid synthase n=1 Tax=Haloferax marinum TaxID=2666143 RepID=A0A6A8GBB2_9EURY|nr:MULTISPECIES: cobyric acid synthase [Haloferax]KAB1191149.1 cobyric acid synthase [Haloferax sp. CBA1150]MRW98035.1 cobyric acid synthase [Haloferax marinum]